jgi:hypothetical protein
MRNETTILIKLSNFQLINVNEIFSSFELLMKSSFFLNCETLWISKKED